MENDPSVRAATPQDASVVAHVLRDGRVALLDEGDVDAQRFYHRHGFSSADPTTDERAFYFFRELDD